MISPTAQERKRRPGQPIMVLFVLLLCWGGARAALWESPFALSLPGILADTGLATNNAVPEASLVAPAVGEVETLALPDSSFVTAPLIASAKPVAVRWQAPTPRPAAQAPQVLASHQLLWLAAMGQLPVPQHVAAMIDASPMMAQASVRSGASTANTRKPDRWSLDGWLFVRPNSSGASTLGPQPATYGASQAGALLRYRLKPGNARRPTAYMRGTQALAAGEESELAAGLSVRPLSTVPVAIHAELRATRSSGEIEVKPAAFAVTQLPPVQLPLGLRAEAYAAAGYVGGSFSGAFADGQARIDREVTRFDLGSVRAGAGAWGGAQRGAARVDVGPSATAAIKLGDAPARLSVDYRMRVAGDALPESGIALTLSTGF